MTFEPVTATIARALRKEEAFENLIFLTKFQKYFSVKKKKDLHILVKFFLLFTGVVFIYRGSFQLHLFKGDCKFHSAKI